LKENIKLYSCEKWKNTTPSIFGKNSNNFLKTDQKNPELYPSDAPLRSYRQYYLGNGTFNAAKKYIESGQRQSGEATGGSDWKKYMHPNTKEEFSFLNYGQQKNWPLGENESI
jgi:hypothetical protein